MHSLDTDTTQPEPARPLAQVDVSAWSFGAWTYSICVWLICMAVGSSSWQGRNFKGLTRFHTADQSTLMTKLLLTLDLNWVPKIIIYLLNVNIVVLKAKIRPPLNKEVFQDFIVDLVIVYYKVGGESFFHWCSLRLLSHFLVQTYRQFITQISVYRILTLGPAGFIKPVHLDGALPLLVLSSCCFQHAFYSLKTLKL